MTKRLSWIFLVFLLFVKHGAGDKHGILQCAPQNVQLSNVSQELQITWESHPSCMSLQNLLFEMIVLVEDKQVHHEELEVTADMGSSHWWKWTSSLPLECVSHSVKVRSRCENQTSPWITETLPGLEPTAEIQVFPQDYVFEVGSRVTFCCIIPNGETFFKMYPSNYNEAPSNTSMLNNHTYALTVDLLWPTYDSDADIKCKTDIDVNGASTIIGYQPTDSNLTCETRDFLSAECFWTVGPQILTKPTKYWLLEQKCNQPSGKCSQKVDVERVVRNWTLIARNVLGSIELIDEADLTKRVYMYAPERVANSSFNARNATLTWFWTVQRYNLLNLTCQITVSNGASKIQVEKNGIGLRSVVLDNLIPNLTYIAMVRCATLFDFWKWGNWSKPASFHTKGDIPDAVDVWMRKEGNQTLIIWKLLEDHQSHGHIIDYEVTWTDSETGEQKNKLHVVHPNHSVALNLNSFKKYSVKVTARNAYGGSNPSQIIIFSQSGGKPKCNTCKMHHFRGIAGGFSLSWAASSNASCGYILDWCPVSGGCSVDWLKLPPNKTNATIYLKNFKDGVRYILSIYSCTVDAPVLLEIREGYLNEQIISDNLFKNVKWEQHGSDLKITWNKINIREQSAFIEGYVLQCRKGNESITFTTEDPEVSSLTAKNLDIASYTFSIYAKTSVGNCCRETLQVTLDSQMDNLFGAFLISLLMVLILLLVIIVVCYRHWAWIKQKVYPTIPEPVLTGKWLSSKGVAPFCPSEELVMAVPELYCQFTSSEDGYICQKDKCSTCATTLAQNQTLKKHIPCEVILPRTSSSICARFNEFPNPIYNLVLLGNKAQIGLETKFQDFEEEFLNNCQLQDFVENETDADRMSCVSTYIVLPYSP